MTVSFLGGKSMKAKRIIPCLDVAEGRVVKGTKFLNLQDAGDPIALARFYDRANADELVVLDITASQEGRKTLLEVVQGIAEVVTLPFTVGGGIASLEDMERILSAGADKVSLGSAAVKNPELVRAGSERFGRQRVVVAVDAKRVADGSPQWEVYIHGGRKATGLDVVEWVQRMEDLGAGEILLTSMDADGTKDGYDNELYRTVTQRLGIPVIASGGAGTLEHLRDALLLGGADAVLAASIFHFGTYTIQEAKDFLAAAGIPVRLEPRV